MCSGRLKLVAGVVKEQMGNMGFLWSHHGVMLELPVKSCQTIHKGECRTLRKPLAARRSKSYKGAVLAGSSMASGITTVGQFDNKRGCGLPFLRTKKDSVKLVRRSLFQDVNQTKTLFAETGEAAAVQSDSSQIGSDGAQVTNTNIAPSDEVVGTWNAVTEAAMSPSEEEAYLEAGIADYEQEDTLLYSEEDLLDDLAFRAAVANVQTIYAADREKINAEFAQNLQKCRVARQVKPPAGPSKPSSRSNTPIRAVSFKKALAMKVMSLRKTPKQKIAKEGTLKDKDKSPMKF